MIIPEKIYSNKDKSRKTVGIILILTIGAGIFLINSLKPSVEEGIDLHYTQFDVIEDIDVLNDELYIIGWKYNMTDQRSYVCLDKMTKEGTTIWNKTWSKNRGMYGRQIYVAYNHIYIICELLESDNEVFIINKLDLEGNSVWNATYKKIRNVVVLDNMIYLLTENGMTLLDMDGNYRRHINMSGVKMDVYNDKIYVTGSKIDKDTSIRVVETSVINKDGIAVWNMTKKMEENIRANDVCVLNDRIHIIGSGLKGSNLLFVLTYDLNGKLLYESKWNKEEDPYIFTNIINVNNNLYGTGSIGKTFQSIDAILALFNEKGEVIEYIQYGEQGKSDNYYGICSDGDKIYLVGSSESGIQSSITHGILIIYNYRD